MRAVLALLAAVDPGETGMAPEALAAAMAPALVHRGRAAPIAAGTTGSSRR